MPGESLGSLVGRQVGRKPRSPQAAGAAGEWGVTADTWGLSWGWWKCSGIRQWWRLNNSESYWIIHFKRMNYMAHELYLNNNNGNHHLSWSCQMLIKLHDACNGPHCPPRDGPKRPVFSPTRPTLPTSSSPISPQPGLCPRLQTVELCSTFSRIQSADGLTVGVFWVSFFNWVRYHWETAHKHA